MNQYYYDKINGFRDEVSKDLKNLLDITKRKLLLYVKLTTCINEGLTHKSKKILFTTGKR